jgi:uncharacterized protein YggL (DUF469 family)
MPPVNLHRAVTRSWAPNHELINSNGFFFDHTFPVTDDFKILLEFLEGDAREVAGRTAAPVSADVREKIARFASGKCTEEDRAEMKKLLQEQPDLIAVLVSETKAIRQPPE